MDLVDPGFFDRRAEDPGQIKHPFYMDLYGAAKVGSN
jgi:hypothetical protein